MYLRLVEQEAGPLVKESLRDGLSQARDEVARLDRLLANLVDLHRHGHVMIRPGLVDAGRVVSDAVRRTSWELGVAQVSVERRRGGSARLVGCERGRSDRSQPALERRPVRRRPALFGQGRPRRPARFGCASRTAVAAFRPRRTRACFAGGSGRAARAPPAWAWACGSFASWRKRTGAAPRSRAARAPARPSPSAWLRSALSCAATPLARGSPPPPRTRADWTSRFDRASRPLTCFFRRVGCIHISKRQPTRRKKPTRGEQRPMKGQRARRA